MNLIDEKIKDKTIWKTMKKRNLKERDRGRKREREALREGRET